MSISLPGFTFSFESPVACTLDILCAFMPAISLCYLCRSSCKSLRDEKSDENLEMTPLAHTLKLLSQVALISLLLVSMVLYLGRLLFEKQEGGIFVPYIILCGVSAVNWMIGLVFYTLEYQKTGDNSDSIWKFWLISLICQSIGIFTTEWLIIFKDTVDLLEIVHITYLAILTLLVIHGAFCKNNHQSEFPKEKLSIISGPYRSLKTEPTSGKPRLTAEEEALSNSAMLIRRFLDYSENHRHRSSTDYVEHSERKSPSRVFPSKDSQIQPEEGIKTPLLQDVKVDSPNDLDDLVDRLRAHRRSPQKLLRQEPLFDQIYIHSFVSLDQQQSPVTLYLITYTKDGKEMTTHRTHSEFHTLYLKTREQYPDVILPSFPEDNNKTNKFHGPKASEEKNHQLGLILKEISEKNLRTPQLDEFLKSDEINISASRSGRQTQTPSRHLKDESFSSSDQSFSSSDLSQNDEPKVEEIDDLQFPKRSVTLDELHQNRATETVSFFSTDNKRREDSMFSNAHDIESLLNCEQNPEIVSLKDSRGSGSSEEVKSQSKPVPAQIIGETIISDYTAHQTPQQPIRRKRTGEYDHYKVEIVGAWNDEREGNPTTFYEFQVKDLQRDKIYAVSKRYSDFTAMHAQLKEYAKKKEISLPLELPNRGALSQMTRKTDPALIQYRKFALPHYLQTLLNKKGFQDCSILLEFLQLDVPKDTLANITTE